MLTTQVRSIFKAIVDYVADSAKQFGIRYANTQTNEDIETQDKLLEFAKKQINDTPKTELDVNYGYEKMSQEIAYSLFMN